MFAKLKLILWKNLVIRKRHWLLTITEIIIPILLFTLVTYGRSKVKGLSKLELKEPTYYDVISLEEIYSHLDVGELNLWYSPFTDFTERIVKNVQEKLQIPGDAILGFTSKKELLAKFGRNSSSLIAAINFRVDHFTHLDYDLGIYDKYFKWNTDKLFASTFIADDEKSGKYLYKGYAALQVAINTAFMKLYSPEDFTKTAFSIQEFPDPPKTVDSGLNQLFMYFLPLITIFSFIFLCPAVLQRVGEERHSGTKEFMKMVGMNSWMIWLGWLIHALVTNFLSICVIVILMKVPCWGVSYPLIEHSDGTVLFIFLFLYCMAAITFCFFIGSLFNTPSISTVVGILIWIFSYFVPRTFLNSHPYLPWRYKILLTLFPNVALHFGYSSISVYEMREVGIQWTNIFKSGSGGDSDVTMGGVFLMLIFEMFFFMFLTLYIERVKPGEYGIARPYFYPFSDLKNCISRLVKFRTKHNSSRIENTENASLNRDVEQGYTPCIHLERLRKKFSNHIAVDDLTMDIHKNQITVLLGHNGAGKTTTMSILTGMINATSGYVTVEGQDIKKNTNEVRRMMGLCPQHNLLFPDLTVLEHLQFFAMLKRAKNPTDSAKTMLKLLGIEEKNNDMACTLSGGMKRKLCLGMALIGDSKVLILDEPTSGMDPESRRKIWDLLIQYRKEKTILITTHFMEEADVLGDRIAIMANGRLQCYDTPLNLKMKYNTGYHLSLMVESKNSVDEITNTVKLHTMEADLLRETNDTLVYVLPLGKNYTGLFKTLEENKEKWDIVNVGLSLTTLNDVFLKAKDEIDAQEGSEVDGNCQDVNDLKYPSLVGLARIFNNYCSLFSKRIYFLTKKYYWFVPPISVTICILLLALWLGMSNEGSQNGEPPLKFTLQIYGKPQVYYGGEYSSDPKVTNLRSFYSEMVSQQSGKPIFREDVSNGIIEAGIENIANYKQHLVVAAEFNKTVDELYVNALYSPNTLHGLPISINLAMNAMIKTLLNSSFAISTNNVPLQPLHTDYNPSELSPVNIISVWLILIPLSLLFLTSSFIIFPHTEVSTNFIQIQAFAGIRTYCYWLSNLFFDILFSFLLMLIILFAVFLLNLCAFDSKAFQTQEMILLVGIFLWYTIMSLPFTYLLSYRRTLSGGFSLLLMLGIFFGFIPTIVVVAMEFSNQQYYIKVAKCLKFVFFLFSPPFTLNYVTVKFAKKYVENFNWKYMDPNKQSFICQTEPNPCCFGDDTKECQLYQNYLLSENFGLLSDLSRMLIPFVLYFVILWIISTEPFKKFVSYVKYFPQSLCKLNCKGRKQKDGAKQKTQENGSNTKETSNGCAIRKTQGHDEKDTLLVENLTKSYGPKAIVRNLKLQLKKNSCFGLLGVNGAGKSTTFRMLTKELFFDDGDVTLKCGNSIPIKEAKYCENIGYCPQEDCLNYFLTGYEVLYSMALLRGYPRKEADEVAKRLLKYFGLDEYKDKPCSEYSGGNKRKLCTCVAFLAYPKVILLDEPTSGVDPASRRNFWNVLSSYKKHRDTSFLLCSHSMEECENLCDEIGIMKDGTIEDSGSLLDLKSKYQNGFKVTIKLKYGVDKNIDRIRSKIVSQLNADVIEEYGESLKYQLKNKQETLNHIFETLEKLKEEESAIEDYIISQITLEDIFLNIANREK